MPSDRCVVVVVVAINEKKNTVCSSDISYRYSPWSVGIHHSLSVALLRAKAGDLKSFAIRLHKRVLRRFFGLFLSKLCARQLVRIGKASSVFSSWLSKISFRLWERQHQLIEPLSRM